MPLLNVTIDDASPLITYLPDGAWTPYVSNDAHDDGYTATGTQNASASIEFWGTWIMVKGSKNDYHGGYTVTLDGSPYPETALRRLHTLTISNDEWLTLDIDSITWTCDVGGPNNTNSPLQTTVVDDTETAAFTWLPHGSWDTNPKNLTMFSGQTGHSTSLANSYVNYTFSVSDAVAIYGTTGPGHSRYSVRPPDRPAEAYTAGRDLFSSQVLLYFGGGFGAGNHTVTLVNEGPGLFQVDYAEVHAATLSSTVPVSLSPNSASPVPGPTGSVIIRPDPDVITAKGLSAGVVVAITFVALLFVFLIASLVLLLQRNKTLWFRLQRGYKVQSQFDIGTPPNGAVVPLPYSAPPPPMRSKANLLANDANDDDDDLETRPLNRATTMESHLTASTLVAEAGSYATEQGGRRSSLKALRLVSRWGPNTPTSSVTNLNSPSTRHSASLRHLSLSSFPPPPRHMPRSPSTRHLLQEESQYYDPYAAAVAGIEEVPEDSVEEILRHPIRRNQPSTYQHWQSALP
ncbi:hypothetical protein B0H13DRAFT_2049845 [Mycena leptocephala]|nr:hypothetical protein B0H13DRAFT_2049845 [Mycena leptocephala]